MAEINFYELLLKRYPPAQYSLFSEVSDAAGFNRSGSCDFISIGLWPSRGLEITGIEQKVSRNDWLRELKQPAKAEPFLRFCDKWYLLTGDESVAKLEELPPTWGWLCVKGKVIKCLKEAPKLNPEPINRNFLAALLKRATQELIHPSSIQSQIDAAVRNDRAYNSTDHDRLRKKYDELLKTMNEFETASGVSIHLQWQIGEIGLAVKHIRKNNGYDFLKTMNNEKERVENALTEINAIIEKIKPENEPRNNTVSEKSEMS